MSKLIAENNGNFLEVCIGQDSSITGVRKIIDENERYQIERNKTNMVYKKMIVNGEVYGEGDITIINGKLEIGENGNVDVGQVRLVEFVEQYEFDKFEDEINKLTDLQRIFIVDNFQELEYIKDNNPPLSDNEKIYITENNNKAYYWSNYLLDWVEINKQIDFTKTDKNDIISNAHQTEGIIYVGSSDNIPLYWNGTEWCILENKRIIEVETESELIELPYKTTEKLYITKDTNKLWRFDGTSLILLNNHFVHITDLNNLDKKANNNTLYIYNDELYRFNNTYIKLSTPSVAFVNVLPLNPLPNILYVNTNNSTAHYLKGGTLTQIKDNSVIEVVNYTELLTLNGSKNTIYITKDDSSLYRWDNTFIKIGDKKRIYEVNDITSLNDVPNSLKKSEILFITKKENYIYRWDNQWVRLIPNIKFTDTLGNAPIGDEFSLLVTQNDNNIYRWDVNKWTELHHKRIFIFSNKNLFPIIGETSCIYIDEEKRDIYIYEGSWILIASLSSSIPNRIIRATDETDLDTKERNIDFLYIVGEGNDSKIYTFDDILNDFIQYGNDKYIFEVQNENVFSEITGKANAIWISKDENNLWRYDNGWVKINEKQRVIEAETFNDFPLIGDNEIIYVDKSKNHIYRFNIDIETPINNKYELLENKRIIEYTNIENTSLPNGEVEKLYIETSTNTLWRWDSNTSTYIKISKNQEVKRITSLSEAILNDVIYILEKDGIHTPYYVKNNTPFIIEKKRIIEGNNITDFPSIGETNTLYIKKTDNTIWRWNGLEYTQIYTNNITYDRIIQTVTLPISTPTNADKKMWIRTTDNTLWRWDVPTNQIIQLGKKWVQEKINETPTSSDNDIIYIDNNNTLWRWNSGEYNMLNQEIFYVSNLTSITNPIINKLYVTVDTNNIYYYNGVDVKQLCIGASNLLMTTTYENIDLETYPNNKKLDSLYITKDTNKIYRWDGVIYSEISKKNKDVVEVNSFSNLNVNTANANTIYITKNDNKLYRYDSNLPISERFVELNKPLIQSEVSAHIIKNDNKTFSHKPNLLFTGDNVTVFNDDNTDSTIVKITNNYFEKWKPFLKPKKVFNYESDESIKGFNGMITDGEFVYVYGLKNELGYHGNIIKIEKTDCNIIAKLPNKDVNDIGINGAFMDGKFGYFMCGRKSDILSNNIIKRVLLYKISEGDIENTNDIVTYLNLSNHTSLGNKLKGFGACCTEGTYGYFAPNDIDTTNVNTYVLKLNLNEYTFSNDNINDIINVINLANINKIISNTHSKKYMYSHCLIYENYLYLIPEYTGLLLKINLSKFTISNVTVLDLTETNVNLKGFTGGCIDGKWLYLCSKSTEVCRVLLDDFTTIEHFNMSSIITETISNEDDKLFNGCVAHQRFIYYTPYKCQKFLRFDKKYFNIDNVNVMNVEDCIDDTNIGHFSGSIVDNTFFYLTCFMDKTLNNFKACLTRILIQFYEKNN